VQPLRNTAGLTSPALWERRGPMSPEARERSFDELARGLASGDMSRRRALRLMGAALVGGTLASLGIGEAAADPPGCKRNGKHCKRDTQCCSEKCVEDVCGSPSPPTCTRICSDPENCFCAFRESDGVQVCVSCTSVAGGCTPVESSCDECGASEFCVRSPTLGGGLWCAPFRACGTP
jgi:hypothetical protein